MPTTADTALDNTDEHSTTALYRAAVGEVNSAYYLPLFARFEAADRAGLSWNGSAALYTLNWLAFRHLWHAALVYAGALVAMALGIFGIGRLVFQFSETTQWALLGGLALLSVLLPGLGANALLHKATRKRMEAALKATPTVADACTLLGRKAPTRKSLIAQMIANALVAALLGYAWLQLEAWISPPAQATAPADARNVAVGRTIDLSAPPSAPTAASPAPTASSPSPSPSPKLSASAASTEPSAPVTPASSAPARNASAPTFATATPQAAAPTSAAASSQPASAAKPSASAPTAAAPATAKPAAPAKIILLSKPIAAEAAAAKTAATANATPPDATVVAPAQRYVVNVGLFAQENNARNALTQLTDADLPVTTQSVKTSQGTRTRVRVGPFETQAEADRAADKIRTMGLDAQVAPQ